MAVVGNHFTSGKAGNTKLFILILVGNEMVVGMCIMGLWLMMMVIIHGFPSFFYSACLLFFCFFRSIWVLLFYSWFPGNKVLQKRLFRLLKQSLAKIQEKTIYNSFKLTDSSPNFIHSKSFEYRIYFFYSWYTTLFNVFAIWFQSRDITSVFICFFEK